MESANDLYIWSRWLDVIWRGPRSSQVYEGPLWNYKGSSGLSLSLSTNMKRKCPVVVSSFLRNSLRKFCCMIAGWPLCIHRQSSRLPRRCTIWLPRVSSPWTGQRLSSWRSDICLKGSTCCSIYIFAGVNNGSRYIPIHESQLKHSFRCICMSDSTCLQEKKISLV